MCLNRKHRKIYNQGDIKRLSDGRHFVTDVKLGRKYAYFACSGKRYRVTLKVWELIEVAENG